MKKTLCALIIAAMLVTLCCFSASADGEFELIPKDGYWSSTVHEGAEVTATFEGDTAVFSGSLSGTWPCTTCYYDPENYITVDVDKYALHYDFKLEGGNTNILIVFSKNAEEKDNGLVYTICNSALGNADYEAGSGDLNPGDYAGIIKLSDFINATPFLTGAVTFDKANYLSANNEVCISGITVYSVNGAVITVNDFEIIPYDESNPPESSEASSADSSAEDSSAAVSSVDTSSAAPADASSEAPADDESSSAPADTSSKAPADDESSASASSPAADDTSSASSTESKTEETPAGNDWLWIVIAVVCVIAVAVVVVIIIKKKK